MTSKDPFPGIWHALALCNLALFTLFMSSVFFTYADDIIETHVSKWRPRPRSSKRLVFMKNICASVYVLHLGKMTWIMSSVLTTLETIQTNGINRVNRARSHTDGNTCRVCGNAHSIAIMFDHRSTAIQKVKMASAETQPTWNFVYMYMYTSYKQNILGVLDDTGDLFLSCEKMSTLTILLLVNVESGMKSLVCVDLLGKLNISLVLSLWCKCLCDGPNVT